MLKAKQPVAYKQQLQQRRQATVLFEKKTKKGTTRVKNPTFKKPLPPKPVKRKHEDVGETVDEEQEDSGFNTTQGESVYEDFDNPEKYEYDSDFDEPHFSQ